MRHQRGPGGKPFTRAIAANGDPGRQNTERFGFGVQPGERRPAIFERHWERMFGGQSIDQPRPRRLPLSCARSML
jgi:hypothetical protein